MQISSQFNQPEMGCTRVSKHASLAIVSMEDFKGRSNARPPTGLASTSGRSNFRESLCHCLLLRELLPHPSSLVASSSSRHRLAPHCVAVLPACSCLLVTLRVSKTINCVLLFTISCHCSSSKLSKVIISAITIGQES